MRRVLIAAAAASLLAACHGHGRPEPKTAPTTPSTAVARGVVESEAGLIRVVAPTDGVIQRVTVEEGAHVEVGQPLAQLDDRQARLALEAADAELGDKRAQAEIAAVRTGGALQEAQRLALLAGADAATRQDADQAAVAARVARIEQAQAGAALRAAEARRRMEAFGVDAHAVRAPAAGRVVRRFAAPGAWAAAASPLFVLEPDGRRVIRAELDEAFADKVRPGIAASVSREFQSDRSYRARVVRIADSFSGQTMTEDPTARADTRVVVVVLSLEDGQDLKLGQRVLVRFAP
jgi:multidrug resistance efflux pump